MNNWIYRWLDGRINEWIEQMDRSDELIDGWKEGIDGWMDGWMTDRWDPTDEWMDKWRNYKKQVLVH